MSEFNQTKQDDVQEHQDLHMNEDKQKYSQSQLDAATHLLKQRQQAIPVSDLRNNAPKTLDDAFAIQQIMMAQTSSEHIGWKCLIPQQNGNVIVAPLLSQLAAEQQDCSIKSIKGYALIEPEIAFVLANDLSAGQTYSNDEIDDAVGETRLALELIEPRFSKDYDANHFERLADGLSNQGLYLGPVIDKPIAYKAAKIDINISQEKTEQVFAGVHPCELPQNPLYWLVNHLTARGISLRAGQVIITGSYCGVVKVAMNSPVNINYQGIGQFSVNFTG
ncbi:2-keto-4-pentenoate hydratase [Shewanella sp. ENK2]|uniref:2-keto-4-pentenoate hydratase n=1 Tax=Shewanella sp. ENK2 TaxID=2775245 RepID=UPI0037482500